MQTKNIERVLHDPSILKGLVLIAIPIFLNNLMKSLHDMVDAIFVARMPGYNQVELDSALTALNIYFPVNFLFISLGIGLSIGTVAIVSQYIGAQKDALARRYASKLFFIGIFIALLVIAFLVLVSDKVFDYHLFAYAMGARDEALAFASEYFFVRAFDLVFVFMFIVYQAIRQAQGETLKPVILNSIGIVLNIILTWLFVAVLNVGVVGAALATVIANVLITPFIIIDLFYSKKHITISLKDMWPDKASIKDVYTFAFPAAFGQGMTAFGFIIIQSLILSYGVAVSSGVSVAARITMLLLYPVVALGQVNATYVGMNIGHKRPERAKKSFQIMRSVSISIMIAGVLVVLPFRNYAISFILGTNTSESFKIGSEFVFWLLMTQPFMAMFQSFISLYNGVGMSRYTMILSLIRLWGLRIPLIFLYMLIFSTGSYEGIYIAMMISNVLIIPIGYYFETKINFEIKVRLDA